MSYRKEQKLLTEYALRSRVGNTAGVTTTGLSYDCKMDTVIRSQFNLTVYTHIV